MKVESFVATLSDIVRFNKTQLRRAQTNLVNAQKRGDRRAVTNIQRKMTIYQYTIDMAQRYISESEYIAKQIAEAGD
jgi:hypothetical protein